MELAGIGVVVALLLAALSVWLPRSVELDQRPPPIVSRLAAPIAPIEGAPYENLEQRLPPWPRYAESSGILARTRARAWAVALEWDELGRANTIAFVDGFRQCLLEEARSFQRDPLRRGLELVVPMPIPAFSNETEEASEYSLLESALFEPLREEVARSPAGGVSMRLSAEAGCIAFDYVYARGKGAAERVVKEQIRKRLERVSRHRDRLPTGAIA